MEEQLSFSVLLMILGQKTAQELDFRYSVLPVNSRNQKTRVLKKFRFSSITMHTFAVWLFVRILPKPSLILI